MSWFVNAPIGVAIVVRGPDREIGRDRPDEDRQRLRAPVARRQGVGAARTRLACSIEFAVRKVQDVARLNAFMRVPIGAAAADAAVGAMRAYSKARRHRARPNRGDHFASADAKTRGARLRYKGADLAHTDMTR